MHIYIWYTNTFSYRCTWLCIWTRYLCRHEQGDYCIRITEIIWSTEADHGKGKETFYSWFSTAKLGQDQEYWKVDCDTGKVLPGSGLGGCWWWRGSWWGWWWGWGGPPPPMMRWGLELKSGMLAVFVSRWLSRTEEHNRRLGNISQKPRATRHRLVGTGYSCAAEEGVWIWHAAAASSSTSACRGGAAPATASATIAILPSWCLASSLNLGV